MASVQQGVSENSVKYMLFTSSNNEKGNLSLEELDLIAEKYISQLSSFISSYIWQNDMFNLRVVEGIKLMQPYLEGITCFDDNIEDEWFIVYLLLQLTKKDPNLVVKVEDNDGEFLLIEAADYIPKWLNPETSINRVFLYQGSLHIIPIAQNPGQITPVPSGVPSITDAIEAVRQFPLITKAEDNVLQAIEKRIKSYPGKIRESQHRAHCYIPAGVKAILTEEPRLLSAAVRAFYLRDPLDLKACRAMKYFPPETRIMSEVNFTRCLYAQLMNQQYEPDKRTGWNLPPVNNTEFKSHDLGMKLACGFEILASSAHKTTALEEGNLIDLDFSNDVRWKRFIKLLMEKGYFRGEIDGSKLHRQLLFQARNFYIQTLKRDDSKRTLSPGSQVLQLLDKLSINYEELKEAEKLLQSPDDDSWMEITSEKLDEMLEEKCFTKNQKQNIATSVTSGLKDFLHHTSDLEGAEFPSNKNAKKQKVSLDTDAFSDAVNTILDFTVPGSDDDRSSSSMSGYTDEEDEEVDLGEENKDINPTKELIKDMKMYMNQMDQELDETTIGLSFEKLQSASHCIKREEPSNLEDSVDINDEFDDFRPVDVDLTALKNILESYSSQQGLPGPASNLFASMGVQLPQNTDT